MNEEVNGWKGDVISLVSDSDLNEVTFLHRGEMGKILKELHQAFHFAI